MNIATEIEQTKINHLSARTRKIAEEELAKIKLMLTEKINQQNSLKGKLFRGKLK